MTSLSNNLQSELIKNSKKNHSTTFGQSILKTTLNTESNGCYSLKITILCSQVLFKN